MIAILQSSAWSCCRSRRGLKPIASPSSPSRISWATGSSASRGKSKKAADFLSELSSLSQGDLVVHVDHGIGRFEGLRTLQVQGAPHDCLLHRLCRQ